MILAWLCFFDGLLASAVMAAGVVGAHWGLTPASMGLQVFVIGLLNAAIGLALGLVAVPLTVYSPQRRAARGPALVGGVLSLVLVAGVAIIVGPRLKYPPISDVSTDTVHPLEFVHAGEFAENHGRNLTYSPKTARIQQNSPIYAGLGPLNLPGKPDDVFKQVQIIAGQIPNWRITSTDAATRTLEGVATSRVFRFHDDFIIQVRPGDNGSSEVEMRSRSRDQQADLGSNYDRIVSFFNDLRNGPTVAPPGTAQAQP
jgi:uncharacterized protein (DUF1499 family)